MEFVSQLKNVQVKEALHQEIVPLVLAFAVSLGKSKGVFTCSVLASIVTILISILIMLTSIELLNLQLL